MNLKKVGPENCDENIHRAMRAEGPQDFLTSWRSYLSRMLKWQLNFIIRGKRGSQIMPLATARWLWRQRGATSWNRLMCPVAHIHTCHEEIQSRPWVWLPVPAAWLVSSQSELTPETAGSKPFFSPEIEVPYSRACGHLGSCVLPCVPMWELVNLPCSFSCSFSTNVINRPTSCGVWTQAWSHYPLKPATKDLLRLEKVTLFLNNQPSGVFLPLKIDIFSSTTWASRNPRNVCVPVCTHSEMDIRPKAKDNEPIVHDPREAK